MPGKSKDNAKPTNLPVPDFKLKKEQNVDRWTKKARSFLEANGHVSTEQLLKQLVTHTIGIEALHESVSSLTFTTFERGGFPSTPGLGDYVQFWCKPHRLRKMYSKFLIHKQSSPLDSASDETDADADAAEADDESEGGPAFEEDWMVAPPEYDYDSDGKGDWYAEDQDGNVYCWDSAGEEWQGGEEDSNEDNEEHESEDEAEVAESSDGSGEGDDEDSGETSEEVSAGGCDDSEDEEDDELDEDSDDEASDEDSDGDSDDSDGG